MIEQIDTYDVIFHIKIIIIIIIIIIMILNCSSPILAVNNSVTVCAVSFIYSLHSMSIFMEIRQTTAL